MTLQIMSGDCIELMRTLPDNSVDSIVTDPPYGLGFMGKAWDALPPGLEWAEECLRVLKPGGHVLAFGGSRTWHRLAVAVEDAGFEIRDSIAWMYGSGFPKSQDVSKAIDKTRDDSAEVDRLALALRQALPEKPDWVEMDRLCGAKNTRQKFFTPSTPGMKARVPTVEQWAVLRELLNVSHLDAEVWRLNGRKGSPGEAWKDRRVIGTRKSVGFTPGSNAVYGQFSGDDRITAPATPEAKQWAGWGTALKPAFEPVVMGRKPFKGTVAANVLAHGTGALNIDASRIPTTDRWEASGVKSAAGVSYQGSADGSLNVSVSTTHEAGRFPANVILDEHTAALLDEQSGVTKSSAGAKQTPKKGTAALGDFTGTDKIVGHNDSGGASRFFYCAKAPKSERPVVDGVAHPTVKPLALMRYLITLVTPPGGVVLEPFAGSGTTVEAALMDGFGIIAMERDETYLPLIQARIDRFLTTQMEDLI